MLRLENPYMLYLLLLIPAMLILQFINQRWKNKARKAYAGSFHLDHIIERISKRKPLSKFILTALAFVFLVIGLANPQLGTKLEEIKREGVDIVIALDVSNSMKAEDYKPNRLERAKMAIEKLVENLHSDRIGIIVFAGEAFIQLPLTSDYSAAKLYTSSISTEIVPTQGTAIGAAIKKCVSALNHDQSKNRAIIVISDGENHEDDAAEAAKEALAEGIKVHAIGMGSVQGAPIPVYNGSRQVGFRSDKQGNTVVSRLDETKLQEIAAAGNGVYVRATNSSTGLSSIFNEINKMEKTEYEAKQYTDFEDRFQPFLLAALILLFIEFLMSDKKSKWVEKVKLFNV
jgi:Ca-activated chloride channel family protein